jgi:hypothetical protein
MYNSMSTGSSKGETGHAMHGPPRIFGKKLKSKERRNSIKYYKKALNVLKKYIHLA